MTKGKLINEVAPVAQTYVGTKNTMSLGVNRNTNETGNDKTRRASVVRIRKVHEVDNNEHNGIPALSA